MIFLTGATGFLGREYLRHALEGSADTEFALLLRDKVTRNADARGKALIEEIFGHDRAKQYLSRVKFFGGDIATPHFGMGDAEFNDLAQLTTQVIHCAASTDLGIKSAEADRVNIGGTAHALELARLASNLHDNFKTYFQVSTAFVAGDTTRTVAASELNLDGPFRNHYERSKAQSEALVRAENENFETCVFRPSVIVGSSITGQTSSFNVIYVPARLMVNGLFSVLPASPSAPFDVVPVDYVAQAMHELVKKSDRHAQSYHLCVGMGRESTPREMVEYLIETFNKYRETKLKALIAPTWLPPEMLNLIYEAVSMARNRIRVLEKVLTDHVESIKHVLPFLPYMIRNPRFATDETDRDLEGVLAQAPLFRNYAERLFKFCLDSNWGRVPV